MKIGTDSIVSLQYTLRNPEGEILDQSEAGDPLVYLHGYGTIVAGLEKALEGHVVGDVVEAIVPPDEGYGPKSGEPPLAVPREQFPPGVDPQVGMDVSATDPHGNTVNFTVVGASPTEILLSAEHPLAGVTLHFEVTVEGVRAATEEEIAHGHAHHEGHEH